VHAFIVAPKVFGSFTRPVDVGRKWTGQFLKIDVRLSDGFCLAYITTFPTIEACSSQILGGNVRAIEIRHGWIRRKFVIAVVWASELRERHQSLNRCGEMTPDQEYG
jgi:hypothetical protein